MLFFFSWAPLNLFNIVDLFVNGHEGTSLHETMLILFTIFHFCAMSSVCSNPVMYGFLNENIRTSLAWLGRKLRCCDHNYEDDDGFSLATGIGHSMATLSTFAVGKSGRRGRRGTESTLQSNFFTSPRQSFGNIHNIKRSSSESVNNNINNNGRLSVGSVRIEVYDRFIKEPSIGANNNNKTSNVRIIKNNIDQGSSFSEVEANKKGTIGNSNKTQISQSWPLDSKLCGAGPLLPQSSSWTAVTQIPSKSKLSPLWPKSRQHTSSHILTTLKHSETKSRKTSSISSTFPCSAEFPHPTVSVPKITISSAPSTEDLAAPRRLVMARQGQ